jgi:UDP:flavonoid glycosyltransferase YjiC (YdhE family)
MAAGIPQLVMPMGFDQPDNAVRTRRLGVGEIIPPNRFTPSIVAGALDRLLSSHDVAAACRRWSERIDSVASLGRTCDLIEEQYDSFGKANGLGAARRAEMR